MKKIPKKNIRKFDSQEDFRDQERPPRHSERVTDEKITAPKSCGRKKGEGKTRKNVFPSGLTFQKRFGIPFYFSDLLLMRKRPPTPSARRTIVPGSGT